MEKSNSSLIIGLVIGAIVVTLAGGLLLYSSGCLTGECMGLGFVRGVRTPTNEAAIAPAELEPEETVIPATKYSFPVQPDTVVSVEWIRDQLAPLSQDNFSVVNSNNILHDKENGVIFAFLPLDNGSGKYDAAPVAIPDDYQGQKQTDVAYARQALGLAHDQADAIVSDGQGFLTDEELNNEGIYIDPGIAGGFFGQNVADDVMGGFLGGVLADMVNNGIWLSGFLNQTQIIDMITETGSSCHIVAFCSEPGYSGPEDQVLICVDDEGVSAYSYESDQFDAFIKQGEIEISDAQSEDQGALADTGEETTTEGEEGKEEQAQEGEEDADIVVTEEEAEEGQMDKKDDEGDEGQEDEGEDSNTNEGDEDEEGEICVGCPGGGKTELADLISQYLDGLFNVESLINQIEQDFNVIAFSQEQAFPGIYTGMYVTNEYVDPSNLATANLLNDIFAGLDRPMTMDDFADYWGKNQTDLAQEYGLDRTETQEITNMVDDMAGDPDMTDLTTDQVFDPVGAKTLVK